MQAEILKRLSQYLSAALSENKLVLSRKARDGRVNSQDNEREISQALELYAVSNEWFKRKKLSIHVSPPRHWYDFVIEGKGDLFLPVNVKVSTLRSSDNLSSKEGVFYALTGVDPAQVSIATWEQFCQQLGEHLGTNPIADYYFLVINKNAPGDVFWTSLKQISTLVPNGNNPPFQCNWSKNREQAGRSDEDAQRYVLNILGETFRLRAEALKSFDKYLKKFIQE